MTLTSKAGPHTASVAASPARRHGRVRSRGVWLFVLPAASG
jgi:hypothetical protein